MWVLVRVLMWVLMWVLMGVDVGTGVGADVGVGMRVDPGVGGAQTVGAPSAIRACSRCWGVRGVGVPECSQGAGPGTRLGHRTARGLCGDQ